MAEKLTIKRRVELQLIAALGALLPTWMDEEVAAGRATADDKTRAGVKELDQRGNDDSLFSLYLDGQDEELDEGSQGDGGTMLRTFEMILATRAMSASTGDEPANAAHDRWIGRLEEAVSADPYVVEAATSQPLAIDIVVTDTLRGPFTEDMPALASMIVFEVHYETLRKNPYQGPANTERTAPAS